MCGRYSIYTPEEELEERFGAAIAKGDYQPHFNAAPSFDLPVILNENPERIIKGFWGFVPHWAKEGMRIRPQINARAETLAEKPFFREAFKNKRCLVLADGFFEWDKKGNHSARPRASKTPYRIILKNEEPFAFAGIWDEIEHEGKRARTFAIITTEANGLISEIHDRMPVILKKEDEEDWLDPALTAEDAQSLLEPLPEQLLDMYEVSSKVNSPKNDAPEILKPVK